MILLDGDGFQEPCSLLLKNTTNPQPLPLNRQMANKDVKLPPIPQKI